MGHGGQAVREAVERDPGQVSPSELDGSAAGILGEAGFEPGFDLAPQRLAVLRKALRIVARDLPTAGIDGEPHLVVVDGFGPAAGVRLADGRLLTGDAELSAFGGEDLPAAVAAMADHVQAGLLERTWKVWPQCAEHRLGVHSVERVGVALWWCSSDDGHPLAPVGALPQPGATTHICRDVTCLTGQADPPHRSAPQSLTGNGSLQQPGRRNRSLRCRFVRRAAARRTDFGDVGSLAVGQRLITAACRSARSSPAM